MVRCSCDLGLATQCPLPLEKLQDIGLLRGQITSRGR